MRIEHHPILGDAPARKKVNITVDGRDIEAYEGESIAAAMLASGIKVHRTTPKNGEPRGVFCNIGRCTDCIMRVDGQPNVRTCVTRVREGMRVESPKGLGSRHHMAGVRGLQIGRDLLEEAKGHGIELLLDTVVWGVFPDNRVAFTRGDGEQGSTQGSIVAKNILIATGAVEKAVFFRGWTKPGVMGAGAAQKMMHVHRVLPGKKVLMVGSGNVGLIVSYQLAQAGVDGKPLAGTELDVSCDLICLAVGLRPFDELARASGLNMKYVGKAGGFVPIHDEQMETARRGVYVAGDLTGIEEANTAMDEGRLAGIVIAEKLGRLPKAKVEELKNEIRKRLANLRIGSFGLERAAAKQAILAEAAAHA